MPAIAQKVDHLKGCVFTYEGREGKWYYREYLKSSQSYKYLLIDGAKTLEQALEKAIDAYTELRQREVGTLGSIATSTISRGGGEAPSLTVTTARRSLTPYSRLTDDIIERYLKHEQQRCEANLITEATLGRKRVAIGIHLKGYFKHKIINRTSQIKENTFDDYSIFRGKDTSKLTRNFEIKEIRCFISWCLRNEYLHPKLNSTSIIKKERVNEEDLTANPAINSNDWSHITKALRDYISVGRKHSNPKTTYWRTLFHTFCLVAKQTGMRPDELRNLKWKDIEFLTLNKDEETQRKEGKMSSVVTDKVATCYIHIRKSKTKSQREVPAKCGRELRRWKDFIFEFITDTKRKHLPDGDSCVFGNCDNDYRPYSHCFYSQAWSEGVREPLHGQLKGHPFSDKHYTLYSMRATFIEDNLLQEGGCDVFYLARVCGHDVKILQRHYERITVRERAGELKQIPYGKKKQQTRTTKPLL